jgi:hypothetical protein
MRSVAVGKDAWVREEIGIVIADAVVSPARARP